MLDVHRSDSLREGEAGIPPSTTHLLPPIMSEVCLSAWKPTERNVSFNRDVHVKRIGRAIPRASTALVGDGEGRLISTPIHKESIAHRTKEDLAEEAALVLRQASNLHCVTQDNKQLPGRFSTLPVRRNKKRPELPLNVRHRSEEIDSGSNLDLISTPKTKKNILDGSTSDSVTKGLKSSLAKFFSPKFERKRNPVRRSVSDIGVSTRSYRKTSTSNNEVAHLNTNRAKKQLSPIIETSPQANQQPFQFNSTSNAVMRNRNNINDNGSISINDDTGYDEKCNKKNENTHRPQSYKPYRHAFDVTAETTGRIGVKTIDLRNTPNSPRTEETLNDHRIHIEVEDRGQEEEVWRADNLTTEGTGKPKETSRAHSPTMKATVPSANDKVNNTSDISTMQSGKHGFQQNNEESTMHQMINRLSNDRSPPPQLSKTMISPGPALSHNNNKPFSYTRLSNEFCNAPPLQSLNTAYTQVHCDKRKAYSRYSDSKDRLHPERKNPLHEASPAEMTSQATGYLHSNELCQNNEINHFKSLLDADGNIESLNNSKGNKNCVSTKLQNKKCYEISTDINGRTCEVPNNYESCKHIEHRINEKINATELQQFGNGNQFQEENKTGISHKTSELSARRDLLESRIKSRLFADEIFVAKNRISIPIIKPEQEIIDKPIVPSPVIPKSNAASQKRYMDRPITQKRMSSKADKHIFEKKIHENHGKIYEYEKKVMNKVPTEGFMKSKANEEYTIEAKIDKHGDKCMPQPHTREGLADDTKHCFQNEKFMVSPDEKLEMTQNPNINSDSESTSYFSHEIEAVTSMRRSPSPSTVRCLHIESTHKGDIRNTPTKSKECINKSEYSKSDDMLDCKLRANIDLNIQLSEAKNNLKFFHRKMSKSSQRLNETTDNIKVRDFRREPGTRSYENLNSSPTGHINTSDALENVPFLGRLITDDPKDNKLSFEDENLYILRGRKKNDYHTDELQLVGNQLGFNHSKEICKTYKNITSKCHPSEDEYDNIPSLIDTDCAAGYSPIRYDSDTTAKDSVHGDSSYEQPSRTSREHYNIQSDGNLENSPTVRHNWLDYPDDPDIQDALKNRTILSRKGPFDKNVGNFMKSSRINHESSRPGNTKILADPCRAENVPYDSDRKDRFENSSIENDYRRVPQDISRQEHIESEDEDFTGRQFSKYNRKRTDRNTNLICPEKRKHRYFFNNATKFVTTIQKPVNLAHKKNEKKVTKTSNTMSKVKQLFGKGGKTIKVEKSKADVKSVTNGALTDDEVTARYQEYRGPQLRSVKSAKDLRNDTNQEDCSQRKRLSTPTGSPKSTRLSRSTGTLTRGEESCSETSNTLTGKNQCEEDGTREWFKSLSRKNKTSTKLEKRKIPDNEFLMMGPDVEDAFLSHERIPVYKNLRFFGDTDQESVASDQQERHKQIDEHAHLQRDTTSLCQHNLHMITALRKPARLAESGISSGESTTGDSSQQSQNSQRSQISVVYLHAPTVGEIPGPNERRKAASREELNRPLQSHTRTVSRSVSVLAPWKPRYYKEPLEINYDQQQHQQGTASMKRKQHGRETLFRREKEGRHSKDNLTKIGTGSVNRNTFKLKDKRKVDRTISTESLANMSRNTPSKVELNRSTSVPRDRSKNAGWFKLKNKKSHT